MFPYKQFVPILIILVTSPSCFCSYEEYQLHHNLEGAQNYNPRTHFSFFDNKESNYKPSFETKYDIEKSDLGRLARVRGPPNAAKIVNVDDFGAKGDGRDDTQVRHDKNIYHFIFRVL